jgi:hypothetical protein
LTAGGSCAETTSTGTTTYRSPTGAAGEPLGHRDEEPECATWRQIDDWGSQPRRPWRPKMRGWIAGEHGRTPARRHVGRPLVDGHMVSKVVVINGTSAVRAPA